MFGKIKKINPFNLLMMTVAGIFNAVGVTLFLSPVELYDSGISGTSMLLSAVTPEWLSLSLCLLILNIPLFLYGLKKEGALFTFYGIYAVAVYSAAAWVINNVFGIGGKNASPLAGTDILLCAIFGGIICGCAVGISIHYGGALDGVEVLAVIVSKKLNISVSSFCAAYNILLYIICAFARHSWRLPLYSIITYVVALKVVDYFVDGLDRAKAAIIVTVKPEEVCAALSEEFGTGTTRIEATGGFSGKNKTMVYFVVNRFQVTRMKNIVHEIDKSAFITINDVADVFSLNDKD